MNHPGKTLAGFKCWGEQLRRGKGTQLTEKGKLVPSGEQLKQLFVDI
jgi:hypothetical protein